MKMYETLKDLFNTLKMPRKKQKEELSVEIVEISESHEMSNDEASSIDLEAHKIEEELEEICKANIYNEMRWREECEKWDCVVNGYFADNKTVTVFKPINVPIKSDIDMITSLL
ncbi:hypothetical protein EDEG_01717 [Edhazardia aedis USNM 41457]|uniref:Uncharacterized protein n=1 Tax=Edhazardia aedis (strain USNM 41457) TaxID=1003232 RepID=J9D904_EDHAE|nr:hypothetical protein EDEG_01717 [Edhazardia aedis USNM 41457]|eukprot:EJW03984.1 hypothetical protein EDEG_01717 [Edhazardia aedis USNM 41457]